jgi:hypothetical protein
MGIFGVLGLLIGSWIFIIVIHGIAVMSFKKDVEKYGEDHIELLSFPKSKAEMVEDGNNLLVTGIAYFGVTLLCYYFNKIILSWVCIIALSAFCLPSVLGLFGMIKQAFTLKNKYITFMTITAIVNTIVPLIIAINIYFLTIAR